MNLNPQNCRDLNSKTYRELCDSLSLSPSTETIDRVNRAFTGVPDTDILILDILSDEDLISVCNSNKYLNDLCNTESFWLNKTVSKYGYILGSIEDISLYIPPGTSWKEYYLWLSDLNKDLVEMLNVEQMYNRPDLTLILDRPVYIKPGLVTDLPMNFLVKSHKITTRRILALDISRYFSIPYINKSTLDKIINENELTDKQKEILSHPVILARLEQEVAILHQRNGH